MSTATEASAHAVPGIQVTLCFNWKSERVGLDSHVFCSAPWQSKTLYMNLTERRQLLQPGFMVTEVEQPLRWNTLVQGH